MEQIGFYTEDELMDLLQEGAIDMADFLRYSPQWHDIFTDFCLQRGIAQDYGSASLFLRHMELEEVAAYDHYSFEDDYDSDYTDYVEQVNQINDLDFLY